MLRPARFVRTDVDVETAPAEERMATIRDVSAHPMGAARSHDPFDAALVRLASRPPPTAGAVPDIRQLLAPICGEVASTVGVDRVGVWRFSADGRQLACIALADMRAGGSASRDGAGPSDVPLADVVVDARDLPEYFAALLAARHLAASDARQDPRTSALGPRYLQPLGVDALLDCPIRFEGRVVGVLCAEHRGGPRTWTDGEEQFVAAAADLTAVIMQTAALRASEARFRALFECSPLAALHVDRNGVVIAANGAARRLGSLEELVAGTCSLDALLHQDDVVATRQAMRDVMRSGAPCASLDVRVRHDADRWRWCILALSVVDDGRSGRASLPEFVALLEDVHERREAERALRASEERFRQLAQHIPQVFWITTPDKQRVIYVSPADEQVWGRSCASLYLDPLSFVEAVHPDDRPFVRDALLRQREGGYALEYRVVHPDGRVRWVFDRAFLVPDATGNTSRLVGIADDITERRALEQQLRQAQNMDAIGRVTAGIAHDFNNVLAIISASAQIARADLPPVHVARLELDTLMDAIRRAAELTRQMLTFSRGVALPPRPIDPVGAVRDLVPMLRRTLGPEVTIAVRTEPGVPLILGDSAQLTQLVMNLAVNARDAMPDGGTMTIEVRRPMNEELTGALRNAPAGDHVLLAVHDTGVGMDDVTRARVFEPFFTTKPPGSGTGLGLAIVWGIVSAAGGHVHAESAPGEGTRVVILWPRLDPGTVSDDAVAGNDRADATARYRES